MPLIQTENLTKVYGKGEAAVVALDHVTMTVDACEIVAVMGPSGCGKSTLLHLLGGLDRPTEGQVTIDGSALASLSDDDLTKIRRRKIGFVFQFFNLIPILSSVENAALPLILDGKDSAQAKQRPRSGCKRWAWAPAWPICRTSCPRASSSGSPSDGR
jgi:putative ABC transport system ATP-binding protein